MDPAVRPRRSIFVKSAVVKGDFYLILEDQNYRLGAVEQLIWKLANGQNDLETIAKQISAGFDVAFDVALADLTEFIAAAAEADLVSLGHPEAERR